MSKNCELGKFFWSNFDDVVRSFVRSRGSEFFFIQIGANDGEMDDPLRPYIKENPGFSGIFVEPQELECDKLDILYGNNPKFRVERAAISRKPGFVELTKVKEESLVEDWYRGLATTLPDRGVIGKLPKADLEVELVPAISFTELLMKHDVRTLDLLQIDVEGYDYEIIKMIEMDVIRPTIINYETRHLRDDERVNCYQYLNSRGYSVLHYGQDYNVSQRTVDFGVNAVAILNEMVFARALVVDSHNPWGV